MYTIYKREEKIQYCNWTQKKAQSISSLNGNGPSFHSHDRTEKAKAWQSWKPHVGLQLVTCPNLLARIQTTGTTGGWAGPGIPVAKGLHSPSHQISSVFPRTSWEIKAKANCTVHLGTETKMKRSNTEGELRFRDQKVLGSFSTSVFTRFVTLGKFQNPSEPQESQS